MRSRTMTFARLTILLPLFMLATWTACTQKKSGLEMLLQKTTFLHTSLSGDIVTELIFDDTYKIENDEGCVYHLLRDHAVEGNQYIFAIISESGSGSGVFRELHVVDKQTLRTLDTFLMGDRARIEKVALTDTQNDILSITFWTKGDAYTPSEKIEKTYRVNASNLLQQ